jgi:putative cell wall-binding protein
MRTKTFAAVAAAGLAGAVLATAGSASAADVAGGTVERSVSAESRAQFRDLEALSYKTPGGNLRLNGNDRYQTAAQISMATWDQGEVLEVVLANGTTFPDALAWGASGLGSGPLLLTERDRLPDATRAELARLKPCYVVVLGGTSAVSDAVFADAEQYVDRTGCPTS